MKKVIFGILAAFAFSLASIGVSDYISRQGTAGAMGEDLNMAHDVGLPEPPPRPPHLR